MSRVFTKNLANYMALGTSGVGTLLSGKGVYSVHAKVKITSVSTTTGANNILSVILNGTTSACGFGIEGVGGTPKVRISARSVSTDTKQTKVGATTISLATPTYVGGVVNIAGDALSVYLNGTLDGTSTVTFANPTVTLGTPTEQDAVGSYKAPPTATSDQFDGEISEIAVWSIALGATDFATLATGATADTVQAGSLLYYLKIGGTASPELPTVGTAQGTITGSLPAGASPTAALTGVSATAARGTLVPTGGGATVTALTGVGASGALGSLGAMQPAGLWPVTVSLDAAVARVQLAGATIHDVLNDAPNTCTLTFADASPPVDGQDLRITVGPAGTSRLLFAGTVQTTGQSYQATTDNRCWPCTAIDYTARANMRRPFGTFVNVSATTVATTIAAAYAPDFSTTFIAAGLPAVSITFDGSEDFLVGLARVAALIGGYCKVEDMDMYLFLTDTATAPDPVDGTHPPLNDPPVTCTIDDRQLRTRVYGKGHGEPVPTDIASGETILPVADTALFNPLGGTVVAGTTADGAQSEILTYTGLQVSTGGSLVGPGAAPSAPPGLALAAGAGLGTGLYGYAYTDVTAAGEALPSPIGTISVTTVAAPSAAPVPGTPTSGGSVTLGTHDYEVTFVTASGETTPGPVSSTVTTTTVTGGLIANPTTAPVSHAPTSGAGVDNGNHDYKVTFANAAGETLPSTATAQVTASSSVVGALSTPGAPTAGTPTSGSGVTDGDHDYKVTFTDVNGETLPSAASGTITTESRVIGTLATPTTAPTSHAPTAGSGVTDGDHDYKQTFIDANGETPPSPASGTITTQSSYINQLGNPSSAPTVGTATTGGSIDAGTHHYQLTYASSTGETDPSPTSSAATTGVTAPPSATLTAAASTQSSNGDIAIGDSIAYVFTFVTASGETTAGPISNTVTALSDGFGQAGVTSVGPMPSLPAGVTAFRTYRKRNGVFTRFREDAAGAYTVGANMGDTGSFPWAASSGPPGTNTATIGTVLVGITTGPSGTTSRKLYRRFNSTGTFKLVTTIANNSSTSVSDTVANASLGVAAPSSDTTGTLTAFNTVSVTIAVGPSGTTARKLYRRNDATGSYKLVTTVANNTSTSVSDTVANASLGAVAPTSNTTGVLTAFNVISVTGIPIGGAGTISRKVYRRFNGTGTYKLLTTITNNSTTTLSDTALNSTLGVAAPTVNTTSTTTGLQTVPLTGIPTGGALVTSRKLYRRFASTGTFKLVTTIANNTATTFSDTVANASLGAAAPSSNTATANQVSVTAITPGPTGTTSRKLYRTAVNASQLKLLTTLANNTTTTFADSTADASLGANAPTADTSGLTQPTGQVNAASTTLLTASAAAFTATGGWATISGGQTLRYTGISGNTLTGIPAAGAGAITTTVVYGSQVLPAPALSGVTGLTKAMARGSIVCLFVTRNDTAAQAAAAIRESTDTFTSTGIHEYLITDGRSNELRMIALCDADLARFSRPIVTFTYATHDVKTKSGKTVHIALPGYPEDDYVIQEVVIDQLGVAATLPPRFTVTASNVVFTLEAVLRQLLGKVVT
jgi:hypothetical protein